MNRTATGNAPDASTAAWENARYGTQYAAVDMGCSPTYYETAEETPYVPWACDYLGNDVTSTTIIKITGAHSWEIAPSSAG